MSQLAKDIFTLANSADFSEAMERRIDEMIGRRPDSYRMHPSEEWLSILGCCGGDMLKTGTAWFRFCEMFPREDTQERGREG